MTDSHIRKAMRFFVLTEMAAIAIIFLGYALEQNGFIISLGLLLMMGGLVFLAHAGNLKAQERMMEAAEKANLEQGMEGVLPERDSEQDGDTIT